MMGRTSIEACIRVGFLVLIFGLAFQPEPGHAQATAELRVVLLGDSYSSGTGADGPTYGPDGCYRRTSNWAETYVNYLRNSGRYARVYFDNLACHGAKTEDVALVSGGHTINGQVLSVPADTDLVLMTIGGNDGDSFATIVHRCLSVKWFDDATTIDQCKAAIAGAKDLLEPSSASAKPQLQQRLEDVLRALRRKLTRGRVVLLDYPYLERDPDCGLPGDEDYAVGAAIRSLQRMLDSVQRSAVAQINQEAGGTFAIFVGDLPLFSVKSAFAGHEPERCRGLSQGLYVHEFTPCVTCWPPVSPESYHPNQIGHTVIANLLFLDQDGKWGFNRSEPFTLESPRAEPFSGTTNDRYTFRVTYRDPEGQTPDVHQVVVNNVSYSLTQESTSGDGVPYRSAALALPAGVHNYYFSFRNTSDGYRDSQTRTLTVTAPPPAPTGRNVRVANASVTPSFVAPGQSVTLSASFQNLGNQVETITGLWSLIDPSGVEVSPITSTHANIDAYTGTSTIVPRTLQTTSAPGTWTAIIRASTSADDDLSDNVAQLHFVVGNIVPYTQYKTNDAVVRDFNQPVFESTGVYGFYATEMYRDFARITVLKNNQQIATSTLEPGRVRTFDGGGYRIYASAITNFPTLLAFHGRPHNTPFTYTPHNLRGPQGSRVIWRVTSPSGDITVGNESDIVGNVSVRSWFSDSWMSQGSTFREFQIPADAPVGTHRFHVFDSYMDSNDWFFREAEFIVDPGHDASVSSPIPTAGSNVAVGQEVSLGATIAAANGYMETATLTARITGPDGYTYVDLQISSVTGSRSVTLDRSWSTSGLTPGTYTVTFSVAIASDMNPSNNSVSAQVTLSRAEPPAPPVLTAATAVGPTVVDLVWTDQSPNETGFKTERSLDGASWVTGCTTSAGSTSCRDSGAPPDQQVLYQVVAWNSAGESMSNILSVRTPPTPALRWTYPNGGQEIQRGKGITLNWSSHGTTAPVRVVLLKAGGVHTVVASSTANSGAFLWSVPGNLPLGSDYRFRVEDTAGLVPADESDEVFTIVEAQRALGVQSNVDGLTIAVSPNDLDGSGSGVAPMLRRYTTGTTVTLTAPDVADGAAFQEWQAEDGTTYANRVWQATLTQDRWLTARYAEAPSCSSPPVRILSITAAPSTTQPVGTPIMWTVTACGAPVLHYKFWLYDTTARTWTLLNDYGPSANLTWVPTRAGTYRIQVWVRASTSTAAHDAWANSQDFVVTSTTPRVVSLTPNPTSPQAVGASVTWSTVAEGGSPPLHYKFWLYDTALTQWRLLREYEPEATLSWTPDRAGRFRVQVWVRSAASTVPQEAWLNSADFEVTGPPRVLALTPSEPSPVPIGTPVTWTATASGGVAPLSYRFWVYDVNAATWSMIRDYQETNTANWQCTRSGRFRAQVWVRSAGSTATYDAWLGSGDVICGTSDPARITGVTLTPPPPRRAGTVIRIEVSTQGGAEPAYAKFMLHSPSAPPGARWRTLQEYSPQLFTEWTPSAADDYTVQVWVRGAGSSEPWDDWRNVSLPVFDELTVTGVTFNVQPPVAPSTPVTITATAAGGSAPYTYRFYAQHIETGQWSMIRDYDVGTSAVWTPSTNGTYRFQVWVRNHGSTAPFDAWRAAGPFEVSGVTITGLSSNVTSHAVGRASTWTATATGEPQPLSFKFWLWNGCTGQWNLLQDYADASSISWTPQAPCTYNLQVWVRSAESTAAWEAWRASGPFTVAPASDPFERMVLLFNDATGLTMVNPAGEPQRRFEFGRIPGPYAISDDRSRIAFCYGTTGFDNTMWVHDVASGANSEVVAAPWCSTVKWLPGSNTQFIFSHTDGNIHLHDLVAGSTVMWQSVDTTYQLATKDTLGGGLDWDQAFDRIVYSAGVATAGGYGVFGGNRCEGDPAHAICDIFVVANPAGTGSGWETIAISPQISSDGQFAFYVERLDLETHNAVRQHLDTGTRTILYSTSAPVYDGFGAPSLVGDRYLVFSGLSSTDGTRPLISCDLQSLSCSELTLTVPPGRSMRALIW